MRIVAIPRSGVRPIWTALAVVAFVVLAAITAKAEEKVIRIGYQKYGTLILLKAKGSLEAKLKPLGYRVTWAEFPAGPPLLEALNASSSPFDLSGVSATGRAGSDSVTRAGAGRLSLIQRRYGGARALDRRRAALLRGLPGPAPGRQRLLRHG